MSSVGRIEMKMAMDKLEREIEQQFAELRKQFGAPRPSAECVQRVSDAVRSEALRFRRRSMLRARLRPWASVAAAALVVAGLRIPTGGPLEPGAWANADDSGEAIEAWVDAFAESSERFTMLLSDEWLVNGVDSTDTGDDVDPDMLDSLDESVERIEDVLDT